MLILAMICLLTAALAGLSRLAIVVPTFAQYQAGSHAALMIAGFFGTVISLERAVALHRFWPYLAPLCAGLGGIALLLPATSGISASLFVLSASLFLAASVQVYRQMPALFTLTLLLGAVSLLIGHLLSLLQVGISLAMPFWMGFLVLTIAGERLELTRFLPPRPPAKKIFIAVLGLIVVADAGILFHLPHASQGLAAGWLMLAFWLFRYDIARHTVKQTGLTRFVAVCLLVAYAWLAIGALLGLGGAFENGHPWRDGALHAIFLGFVFSMVIGHAPIIFPAVMRVKIPYHPFFYLPLAALQLSLALRVLGNLGDWWSVRQLGGVGNALSLALLVLTILISVRRGASRSQPVA
ncbi:MAG: hypothetical protein CVU16_05300 [Betaproteobacteria bacterium HGW-Betaproteobacteria-10]|nr:MAG: hypothetical protein CVU16_05300 [Betaproteobacteria bacterium HGW-Betaproteobacteria-10]